MATMNFPDTPAVDEVYTAPNGVQYQWDGSVWNVVSVGAGLPGPQGPQGEPGPAGQGMQYKGRIPTQAALDPEATNNELGDFYIDDQWGEGWLCVPIAQTSTGRGFNSMGRLVGQDGAPGPQGLEGPAGADGKPGLPGKQGEQGIPGEVGPQGPAGVDGAEGPAGAAGPQGPAGMGINLKGHVATVADLPTGAAQGDTYIVDADGNAYSWSDTDNSYLNIGKIVGPKGDTGPQGPQGVQGEVGPIGPEGPQGIQGPAGQDGAPGADGTPGVDGKDGAQGPQGDIGPTGNDGATGPAGKDGADGAVGPQGPQGDIGPIGPQGDIGPIGPQGEVGPKGDQGDQGIPGLGITFKGRVATVGDLPATAAQGDAYIIDATGDAWVWSDTSAAFVNAGPIVGPTGPQGAEGPAGATGPQGAQGPAGPTAVSADANNTAKLGTDGLVYVGAQAGAYLPLAGGTMTGPITMPAGIVMNYANTYSMFTATGGVSFRFGATDLMAFSSSAVYSYKPLITAATGVGVQFGTGGAYMSKVSTGIGVYVSGALKWTFDGTTHTSMNPIALPGMPTATSHATTKQYVDDAIAAIQAPAGATIVSIADGATEPAASGYPEGALLVRYTP